MNTTPLWVSAHNGGPADVNAFNGSQDVYQNLGTHIVSPIFTGTRTVAPSGGAQFQWINTGNDVDVSQRFQLDVGQNSIARVVVPVKPVGDGADLVVSVCADLSGQPDVNNPIASTLIPASWTTALAAPHGLAAGGPLAVPQFNTMYTTGDVQQVPWTAPSSSVNGPYDDATTHTSGNYIISAGGYDGVSTTQVALVGTSRYLGSGMLSLSTVQPPLPQPTSDGGMTTTNNMIIYAGGRIPSAPNYTDSVWGASWNPNTGIIGSWSAQTSLPAPLHSGFLVSWNDTAVYHIGGHNEALGVDVLDVYISTMNNGQLGPWVYGPPIPDFRSHAFAAVIGNWLVLAGGSDNAGNAISSVLYAEIMSDGSLGAWRNGPNMPTPMQSYSSGWDLAITDSAIIIVGGVTTSFLLSKAVMILTVTEFGLADAWYSTNWSHIGASQCGAFVQEDGNWELISQNFFDPFYEYTTLTPVPMISIPLPAAGLVAGNAYHLVFRQNQANGAADYLSYGITNSAYVFDLLSSPRYSATPWAQYSPGLSMPVSVYNNAVTGPHLHTWEDANGNLSSKVTTRIRDYSGLLVGLLDSVVQPNRPLESNSTFAANANGWTATNCTITRSNAQIHGGFLFSGLVTPNGVSTSCNVESNWSRVDSWHNPTSGVFFYNVSVWVYMPISSSNVSIAIKWFDANVGLISTSTASLGTVPAGVWTYYNINLSAPVGAAGVSTVFTIAGTPSAATLAYLSNFVTKVPSELTGNYPSVAIIGYPSDTHWPPTSVTQL